MYAKSMIGSRGAKIKRPPTRTNLPLALLVVVTVTGTRAAARPPVDGPQLVVSPKILDFGRRGHNERPSGELTLRNDGDAPLKISKMKPSCSCIKLEPNRIDPIPPGQSRTIRVSMGSGRAMGKLFKRITISSNDPRQPALDVKVGMRVLEGYRLGAREVRFTGVRGGDPRSVHIDVTRHDSKRGGARPPLRLELGDFTVRFGKSRPSDFRASTSPIADGQRITFTLSPDHPEGRIQAEFHARLDGKSLVIPIAGEMFEWIIVEPTFLSFSRISTRNPKSLKAEFVLRSTDETSFRILGIVVQPAARGGGKTDLDFDVISTPTLDAHTVKISVIVDPAPPTRSFFGKILVTTDHREKPELTLRYSGFYAR